MAEPGSHNGAEIGTARPTDFAAIVHLLSVAGLPTSDLAPSATEQFLVARRGRGLIGAVAVERYGDTGLLRSLVVESAARASGTGAALVAEAERRAAHDGVRQLVLLTETAAPFFERLGYSRIRRPDAPAPVQASSEFRHVCPDSAICMIKRLGAAA